TLGLSSDLFYKAHSSTIHVFGEENRQIKREYQRFLTVDVDELRNDDDQIQSRTYFVALNNPKENGSLGYYYGKVHLLTTYMSEDGNHSIGQGIQLTLLSQANPEVLLNQAERAQICMSLQPNICILQKRVAKDKRLNRKRLKSRIQYYSNCVATFQLLIITCGDIQTNPGPSTTEPTSSNNQCYRRVSAVKCPACEKTVRRNQKRMVCNICKDLYHARCIEAVIPQHIPSDKPVEQTCDRCLISLLPFHGQPNLDASFRQETSDNLLNDMPDEHLNVLTSRANQLRLAHLNTQSMVSTFDELLVTISKYPFDIIAMSETWLKNNPHLLEYVNIPGYSSAFRNRDKIRGGGVGVYLRDTINYKRRTDIEDIEPELEHIWLEIPGKNKH
ncbi:Hypothetical predicted protein, partial [Paramuricea clavata]